VHCFVSALGLQLVSEAVRQNFNFLAIYLKFYIRSPVSDFVFLKMYFMLDDSVKVIFVLKYVSRVVFKGGILGIARQFGAIPT